MLDRRYIKKRKSISLLVERFFVSVVNLARKKRELLPADVKSILIIRHNQLGDAVVASPFVAAVREIWPNARVDVLAGKDNYAAFTWVQGVDNVYRMPSETSRLARIRFCRSLNGRFDIVFQTLLDEHYFSRAIEARIIAGKGLVVGRGRGSPIEELYDRHPLLPVGSCVGQLFALLSPFTRRSIKNLVESYPEHRVEIPNEYFLSANEQLKNLGVTPKSYVVLNISARVDFRELGISQAADIARLLIDMGLPVVLLYAPSDAPRAMEVQEINPYIHLANSSSLGESMVIAQLSKLYVGPDTGTAHFAAAGNVPCVVLFSHQARADVWSPYGVPFVSIQANQDQPVSIIEASMVAEYAKQLLSGESITMIVKARPEFFSCGKLQKLTSVL